MQNGKGSNKRPTNLKVFNENYDAINWGRKEKLKDKKPKIPIYKDSL